ncbi:DNA repair and meiosis protein Mre11 [Coprinopsis sp. MPI-PUGE-AT-0042]|nr:DNA repair and meiosis protein Mre11 [Coprinopsis sp. MPI-PUGE-AT-0042]
MSDSEEERGSRAPPDIDGSDPENTIRIMLATDNHIGYNERDPIRGQDSINTFREILQLAVKHEVDFILLAGDLFHENKPSRDCLYQTLALLREYTLGDKPIQVELLSDPEEGKAAGFSFPAINYEDPNLNISIPVFSIHGNHDDPQGASISGALCALDVLSVSGLLNYMGKFDLPLNDAAAATSGINVRPVLLRKGTTQLGLYGIGNVKDQRMHFELRSNRVRMYMPRDKEDWFNLLLVHQNRVKHGPQEYVPEGMFDDSVDLVVWGHEHDCRIVPEPVAGKNYYITQPGSSVATSLADGESIEKHVALLEIKDKGFKLTPIPLRTVRPFVIDEVVLEDAAEEEGLDVNDTVEIGKWLRLKVNTLIDQAHTIFEERNARGIAAGEPELPPMLPLVRLKVDTTNVTQTSNPIRFGQEFQGRVANPRDLLVFHRSKAKGGKKATKTELDNPTLSIDDPTLTTEEKLAKVRVGTLVSEYLRAQELQLLAEGGMSDAIRMFVEKDDIHAIQTHVHKSLKNMLKNVEAGEEVDEDDLEDLLAKAKEKEVQEWEEKAKSKAKGKGKGKAKQAESEPADSEDSMMEDVDTQGLGMDVDFSDDDPPPPPKKRGAASSKAAPAKKAPAKRAAPAKKAPAKRGKKVVTPPSDEDDEDEQEFQVDDDEPEVIELDEDDDANEPPPPPVKKRTNRAATLSQPAAKKAPAKKAAATKKAPAKKPASAATQSQLNFAPAGRSTGRAAAGRSQARTRMVVDDDDDDFEDE